MRCIFTGSLRASQANTDSACYGPFRVFFSLTSRARANLQKSLGMDDSRLSWLNVLLKACSEEWCDGCSPTGSSFAWSAATTPHSVMKTLPAAEFCRKSSLIPKLWANPRLHRFMGTRNMWRANWTVLWVRQIWMAWWGIEYKIARYVDSILK